MLEENIPSDELPRDWKPARDSLSVSLAFRCSVLASGLAAWGVSSDGAGLPVDAGRFVSFLPASWRARLAVATFGLSKSAAVLRRRGPSSMIFLLSSGCCPQS